MTNESSPCVAIVGMRAAGKTTLGAALAAALGRPFVDTDARFVERCGAIGAFVEQHGWDAFRREEAAVVDEALAPGAVVALGGGAVETDAVRDALGARAVVVFLDEGLPTIRARLGITPRPSLTGDDVVAEAERLLVARLPHYRALTSITVPPALTTDAQVAHVRAALDARCS